MLVTWGSLVDQIRFPCEIPVTRSDATQRIEGRVHNAVIINDIQTQLAIACAGVNGDKIFNAVPADPRNGSAGYAFEHVQGKIIHANTGNWL